MGTKTALIAGASSDIGQAIAISLAAEGFNIAAHYHKNFAVVQNIKGQPRSNKDEIQDCSWNTVISYEKNGALDFDAWQGATPNKLTVPVPNKYL